MSQLVFALSSIISAYALTVAASMSTLQFAPWQSDIDFTFYSSLSSRKIDYDKLDDAARKVVGRYEVNLSDSPERSMRMQLLGDALTTDK